MVDRIITPDIRRKNASGGRVVLYSILGLLAIAVVLSSFILADMNRKYINSQKQSADFAHSIVIMCQSQRLHDDYPKFCGTAQKYVDTPVDDQSRESVSLSDIERFDCRDDQIIVYFESGRERTIEATCD